MSAIWIRFVCLVFGVVFSFFEVANARLPQESDLSALMEMENATFDVRKDGTFTLDYEARIAILSEAGREAQAVKNISFNSRASKFELISAKTINGEVETPVAATNVEIKEVGDSKVFDATKEAIIAFPAVRIGSRIAFRYRLKFSEVPIEGFFSTGLNIDLQNVDVLKRVVRSELPLYMAVSDKMNLLNVVRRKEGSRDVVEISNKEKIRLGVVQEDSEFAIAGRLPAVIVSTRQDWKGFGGEIIEEQEKLLAQPLPKAFETIRSNAMREPPARRMASVAGQIAHELRYFGDWRRRNGGHVPRPLQEIADTGYGDCKDVSLVVVAIARAMGLKADLAWIWRSEVFVDERFYQLPNDFGFNHAVARVEDVNEGGRVEWVDATNPVALPGLVLPDIANRSALVLAQSGLYLTKTPEMKASDSRAKVDLTLDMRSNGIFDLAGTLTQQGRAAVNAEWAILNLPTEQFKYQTIRWLARDEKIEAYEMTVPKETNRIVRDLVLNTKFSIANLGLQTTAGVGFPLLRTETIDTLLIDVRDRFSDLWLGTPGIADVDYTMPRGRVVGSSSLDCHLKNEWMVLSRKVKSGKTGVQIRTHQEILQSVIPNAVLRSPEFAKLQADVRKCFFRSAVILSWKPSASKSH